MSLDRAQRKPKLGEWNFYLSQKLNAKVSGMALSPASRSLMKGRHPRGNRVYKMSPTALLEEWRVWWAQLGKAGRWLPLLAMGVLLMVHLNHDGLKSMHVVITAMTLLVAYGGPRLRPIARLALPLLLLVVTYDLHRYALPFFRGEIHVSEPYTLELRWFGISEGGQLVTPATWLQTRTHPLLDLISGFAYLAFVPAYFVSAAWWRFRPGATPEEVDSAERAMWALFLTQLAGFVTYFIYPAAPPWYVDHYGLGPALLSAPPEVAGTARFDALLGLPVFKNFYSNSANVFGAIPSLHCATPLLALLYACRLRSLRIPNFGLFVTVCFAAVYFNHHYIIDVLMGWTFAVLAVALVEGTGRRNKGGL